MTRAFPWLLFSLLVFGCGRNISPKQLNEPCTREGQCDIGLVCLAGVCMLQPDAGPDAGGDAGP